MLGTLVTAAAVSALAAALAGRALEAPVALAAAGAIDAVQAHAVPRAGAPGPARARLALRAEETRAALPALQTQKCCAEARVGQAGWMGDVGFYKGF